MQDNLQIKDVVETTATTAAAEPIELDAVQLKEVSGGTSATGSTAGPNGTW